MEDDLEQEVAQFDLQLLHVGALDGVGDLVGLLDRIGGNGREGLFDIPGATAVRIAQANHDLFQAIDGVGHSGGPGVAGRQGLADFIVPLGRQGIALQHPGGRRQ
ncbi:hypothetical protein D3C75_1170810 [compost metagenome]